MIGSEATKPSKSFPSLRLRVYLDTEEWIGPGKIELLEKIQTHGSISAAGRAMNMSYRRAWALVEEIHEMFGRSPVEVQIGGKGGGGASLTRFGHDLVQQYRTIERSAEQAAHKELSALWGRYSGKA